MSDGEHGIKELRELVVGVNELALYLIVRLKDGVGMDDAMDLFAKLSSDNELRQKLIAAVEGIKAVPDEAGDLSLEEGLSLAGDLLALIPRYREALKKVEE